MPLRVPLNKTFSSEFTVAGGELTPAGTLRRKVILEKYAAEIEKLYRQS